MDIEKIARQVLELYEKISSWEHSVVKGSGLTPEQMHTIEIVGHERSIRMKDLAGKMGITTGTLTVSVDRLEKQGFLIRKRHETDRRSFLIVLTEKGEEYFKEHYNFHLNMTEELVSGLTGEEQEMFSRILDKIVPVL